VGVTNLLLTSLKSNERYKNLPLGLRGIEGVTAILPHNFTIVTPPHPLLTQEGDVMIDLVLTSAKKNVVHPVMV
jgi:hypothetical protein